MRENQSGGDDTAPRANILLVDDQPANLLSLEAVLTDLGQNLVSVRSGDDALRLLLQQDFAVILLDVQMQGLDGFTTAQLIRSRERTRHTPIIFLTAYDTSGFPVDRAYELGAVDYLVKPIVPAILRAKTAVFVDLFQKTERLRRLERREFERLLEAAAQREAEEGRSRRESEERSKRLTEFHQAVMASMGEGLFALDLEGRLTYMNPAAELLLGWKAEELLGLQIHDHIHYLHPDGAPFPAEECAILQVKDGGAALRNHQDFFVRKDGTRFPVACSSAPIISDGSLAGLVVVFRDVTRQKQAQQELRESERRYRALADSMPQIVWTARPDGSFDYFNRRWYEYTGFAEGRSGDESWLPILHPDDVQRSQDSWYEAVRSGDPYQIEYRFKDRASGGYRWHLGRALPVRDEAGRIEALVRHLHGHRRSEASGARVARGQHRQGPVPGDAGPRAAQPAGAAAQHAVRPRTGRRDSPDAWGVAGSDGTSAPSAQSHGGRPAGGVAGGLRPGAAPARAARPGAAGPCGG